MSPNCAIPGGEPTLKFASRRSDALSKSGMKSAAISNGTSTVRTPASGDDSMSSTGNRDLARRIHTAAMEGVPGLRCTVTLWLLFHGVRKRLARRWVDLRQVGGAGQRHPARNDRCGRALLEPVHKRLHDPHRESRSIALPRRNQHLAATACARGAHSGFRRTARSREIGLSNPGNQPCLHASKDTTNLVSCTNTFVHCPRP